MGKPLVFEYSKPTLKTKGSTHLRIETDAYDAIEEIARKCKLILTQVATRLVRHALEDVVLKEVPLYEMYFRGSEEP